jgi:8-oxo-dGTP pyrophosphatase MutT (NUDIX family)
MNNISAGVFFYAKNTQRFLYLLRTDNKNPGNWGIPGGKIEKNESCFESAQREFYEEASFKLDLTKITSKNNFLFNKNGKITNIYIIKSTQQFPAFDITKTNGETDMVEYKKLDDIKNYLIGQAGPVDPIIAGIKFYNQESFRELISKGLL